jgi:hypothetical protein
LQPIRPTFILSDGAQPVASAPESEGTSPIAAVVNAVFFRNSRRDVMVIMILWFNKLLQRISGIFLNKSTSFFSSKRGEDFY